MKLTTAIRKPFKVEDACKAISAVGAQALTTEVCHGW